MARREFLKFIGATATAASFVPFGEAHARGLWFTPLRIPSPPPIYTSNASWLATGLNGGGEIVPASTGAELKIYEVIDDVIVSPEQRVHVYEHRRALDRRESVPHLSGE